MGLFNFNKKPNHNTFNYIPRHYDPKKEELKERLGQYTDDQDPEAMKGRIKRGMRSKHRGDGSLRRAEVKKSNMRLAMIIIMLMILSYVFLQSDYITKFLQSISNNG